MPPSFEDDVRQQVARYVSGDISIREFHEWFAPRAWEIVDLDIAGAPLAGRIELLLAEYSNRDWNEEELRERLAPFAYRAVFRKDAPWLHNVFATSVLDRQPDKPKSTRYEYTSSRPLFERFPIRASQAA